MKSMITMVVPYYRQPLMLLKQAHTWLEYPLALQRAFDIVVVDDGSPEDAAGVLDRDARDVFSRLRFSLYRIDKDVPWNRGMARNLGTHVAETDWVLHLDTDHVLPARSAEWLVRYVEQLKTDGCWYRFRRRRIGAADETRKKDKVDPKATEVEIHEHIDSYLCSKRAFWKAGGYNEDFSGVLGGGSPFLKEMVIAHRDPVVLDCFLEVHTRHSVPDSSISTLPRDPQAFKQRKHEIMAAHGSLRGHHPLRLPWHKVF